MTVISLALAMLAVAGQQPQPGAQTPKPTMKPEFQTGSAIPVDARSIASDRAAVIGREFGECVYRMRGKQVDRFLSTTDPVTMPQPEMVGKILSGDATSECLGRAAIDDAGMIGLSVKPPRFRQMMLEESYRSRVRSRPAVAALTTPIAPRRFVSTGDKLAEAQSTAAFADCVVAADPAGSDALLRTLRGTAEETRAAKALAPVLGQCLTQGSTLKFNTASIRSFVAEGAWHIFVENSPAAVAPR